MKIKAFMAAALVAAVFAVPAAQAEEDGEQFWQKMLTEKAPAVVSVKFVMKMQMMMGGQSQDQERNQEVRAVLIDKSGLVLTSHSHFGIPRRLAAMLRQRGGDVKAVPTDMKVLFGNESEEYDAQKVADDSNLGITFLQILDLKGREVTPIDLAAGGEIKLGQELYGVSRLTRGFDCAPSIGKIMVTSKVEKPRQMWGFAGNFGAVGLPVFNRDGAAVGVIAVQEGSEGVGDSGGMGMMGGGGMGMAPFVIPVKALARSIEMAKERGLEAVEQAKEAAEEAAEEPAEESGEKEKPEKPEEDTGEE